MNKTFVVIVLIIFFVLIYSYYANLTTMVLLSGKVIAFDVENIAENVDNNGKTVNVSSQSIGTLTFIKPNGEFAALGHSISDSSGVEGQCYGISFNSIKKSTPNNPGRIIASLNKNSKIGYVSEQSYCGVFGTINKIGSCASQEIETANRFSIKKGTAYLLTNLDGSGLKEYEIEITGINYLSFTKNLKITVKSQELINKTGGIVQGMSGTPIVQNGKLVGAINCVNTDNPLIAYGIFVDKLI